MIGSSRPLSTKKLEDTLSYPKPRHNMNQNSRALRNGLGFGG